MITQIFLDLDGVLADRVSACVRLFDLDPIDVSDAWPLGSYDAAAAVGVSENEMWRRIHARGAAWWADLEPYPWCMALYNVCAAVAPTTILTSPPARPTAILAAPSLDPSAAAGKTQWLQRHFGGSFRDYLIGPAKASCAHPGAVLIDDADKNCEAFTGRGGASIVFPQRWNSAHDGLAQWVTDAAHRSIAIEDRPVAYVRERLQLAISDGFAPRLTATFDLK